MSVRVNLLPQEVAAERTARRTSLLTGAAVLFFVVVLGLVYLLQGNELRQAERERDDVQAEVSQLQAELATLEQFRQLANELEARNALLAAAMGQEISFARVMNDLSLAFPTSASLRELRIIAVQEDQFAAPVEEVSFGEAVANVAYEGYSVERFAPGVETVIIEFDKVRGFFSTYLNTAGVEEIGTTDVTAFQGTVRLDEQALTRRYEGGLPEEVSP
jgi:hypothetical protein